MEGKVMFTKDSTKENIYIKNRPPYHSEPHIICDLGILLDQFSQIRLKEGWSIHSSEGKVYAQSPSRAILKPLCAIEGDESPFSYMQAAVCYHHLCSYSEEGASVVPESIVDDEWIRKLKLFGYWNFGEVRRSLNPIFFYDSLLHPVVIFFTCHHEGIEVIQKHIHRFDYEGYQLKYMERTWAMRDKGNYFTR
ncbi:hypothetical protein LCL89_14400 [Halobacillus yeomjeoni]|uniref:hypothetical protein n=1 Tax=Halobacillus yeomjeoni TaxID=311194 RepID=UPI001CD414ED|nr:hypothetical protein [Halobacillus yeomjeoni]MCA0985220.1 hypothetical protein [Halobacillus yeomjeoni]